jgi:hypothetical protein
MKQNSKQGNAKLPAMLAVPRCTNFAPTKLLKSTSARKGVFDGASEPYNCKRKARRALTRAESVADAGCHLRLLESHWQVFGFEDRRVEQTPTGDSSDERCRLGAARFKLRTCELKPFSQ